MDIYNNIILVENNNLNGDRLFKMGLVVVFYPLIPVWVSGTRCGNYAKFLEVDFVNNTLVKRIWLEQETGGDHAQITSYRIISSEDGMTWNTGEVVRFPLLIITV